MDGQVIENQQVQGSFVPLALEDYRAYRVSVEVLVDTGEHLLVVSPFGGNAFTANVWQVPAGDVGLDELPDQAALRIAREATGLKVMLSEEAVLSTRVVKTERHGKVYRRLVYTYVVDVCPALRGEMLDRFCLGRDYVGHTWLKHGSRDILDHKFDELDSAVRKLIGWYQGL